ncbi:hypothetical protein BJ170DRAFT_687799 [Xylariales sp. AK1849]|nr:hypothetical protein BJ170DRAFT_687799 [Xylariales sp. AK1849]
MTSSSKRHDPSSSSSKKHSSSKSSKTKSDDWTDITEPEERRRIQNRIAQRKFREKTKEHKEKSERDSRNRDHAGSSYHIPDSNEIVDEEDYSGLPWGSINMHHIVARGHESESKRGSSRDNYVRDDSRVYGDYGGSNDNSQSRTYSYGSHDSNSAGDLFDDTAFYNAYPDYDNTGGDSSHM